jgi:hypothetical protein
MVAPGVVKGAGNQLPISCANTRFEWRKKQAHVLAVFLGCVCVAAFLLVAVPAAASPEDAVASSRLLSEREGRAIVKTAWKLQRVGGAQDCSHLIHQIYQSAGFDYPYQSSFDLYAGAERFARVKSPHAGDLIVWPGHVGIVVNASQHSFYSLVSTGLEEQDYQGPYWRSRGSPRFYRYRIDSGAVVDVAAVHAPTTDTDETAAAHAPQPASETRGESAALEFPSSIVIGEAKKQPTREEVASSISQLAVASANALSANDALKTPLPIVIVAQLTVNRVEIKRDHGWAYLQVSSVGSISGGTFRPERRADEVRWPLKRNKSQWEAIAPADRVYVQQDVAIRNLAAWLARLTAGDAASRDRGVVQRESELANLVAELLASE